MPQGNDIVDLTGLAADVFAESGSVTGTTLTIVLNDGSSFDIDMSQLDLPDEYVVSGSYNNLSELLTLTMNLGAPVQVDLSEAGKDTYVESGQVVGDELILYVGDGTGPVTPISIDISAISGDTYLMSVNLDALSGILSFTMNDNPTTVHTVDLGAFVELKDTRVAFASYNCATDTIELRFNDASIPMVPVDMSCFLDGITDLERGGVAFDNTKNYIAGDVVTVGGKVYVSLTGVTTTGPADNPGDWSLLHKDERGGLAHNADAIYFIGDVVSKLNLLYIAQQPNTGVDPLSDPNIWREYNSVQHTATTGGNVGGSLHNPNTDTYPVTTTETLGATWTFSGLGAGVTYTYIAGGLAGVTVKDGDTIMWAGGVTGSEDWLHTVKAEISVERGGIAWSSALSYVEGDIVISAGIMYQNILASSAGGQLPANAPTNWLVSIRGGAYTGGGDYQEGDMVAVGDDIYVAGPGGVTDGATPPNGNWLLATPDEVGGIEWDAGVTYSIGDVVSQIPGAGGTPEVYVAIAGNNLGQDPETIDVFWKHLDTSGVANVVWDIDHTYQAGDMVAYDGDIWIAAGPTTPGTFIPGEWVLATPDERGGMAWRNDEDYLIGDVITHLGYIYVATNTSNGSTPSGASADWDQIISADSYLENGGIAWSSATPYNTGDLVTHGTAGGYVYVAIRANTNVSPGTNPDDWRYAGVVERGGLLWDTATIYEIGDIAMDATNGNLYFARDQLLDNVGMPPASSVDFWQPVVRGGIGWNTAVVYRIDDVVVDDATGYQYKALQGGPLNIGKRPSENTDYWRLLTTSLVYDPAVPYEDGSIVIGPGPDYDLYIIAPGTGPTTPGTQPPSSPWINATLGRGILHDPLTTYKIGDVATEGGRAYVALTDHDGIAPIGNPGTWRLDQAELAIPATTEGAAVQGLAKYVWDPATQVLNIITA